MNKNVTALVPVAAFLGFASHVGYFMKGEHHMEAMPLFQATLLLPPSLTAAMVYLTDSTVLEATKVVGLLLGTYVAAMFTSIFFYRVCFHRLRSFPGPFGARISKLWHVAKLGNKDNFRHLVRWHAKFGKFVRIGMESELDGPERLADH